MGRWGRSRVIAGACGLTGAVLLSGCVAGSGPAPTASAPPVATGPEYYAATSVWVSPDGEVLLCGAVHHVEPGWGGDDEETLCDDPITTSQLAAEDLPGPGTEVADGWHWSNHIVTGRFDEALEHLAVTAVDDPRAVEAAAPPAPPAPQESPIAYATDEEKLAAELAASDPALYGCTPPPGGWQPSDWWEQTLITYLETHPDAAVGWVALPIGMDTTLGTSSVVGLVGAPAEADVATVQADLDSLLPGAMCVIPSRITAADVTRAWSDPAFIDDSPGMHRVSSDATGRAVPDPLFWFAPRALTPALEATIATYPSGFILPFAWFRPLPAP